MFLFIQGVYMILYVFISTTFFFQGAVFWKLWGGEDEGELFLEDQEVSPP